MNNSQRFWRGLFFILIVTALCAGLAMPAFEGPPVQAAPPYQSPICDLMMAQWTFDPTPTSPTTPDPSTANVTASALESGVGNIGYQSTGSHSGNAWSGNSWSTDATPTSYFEFDVSTVGHMRILMSFWHSRSDTGPQSVSIHYSTDGSTFTEFNTYPINTTVGQTTIDFSSETVLDNNVNAKFRIYGINASGSTGNLRIDDVTFTSCPLVVIDSILPNPTNSGTIVSWHALVNGDYEIRIGGTNCSSGNVVESGVYTVVPSVNSSINSSTLVEGTNAIYICIDDGATFNGFATGSITYDVTAPSITSFARQSPTSATTNADTLTFRVTFSEPVTAVDSGDFTVVGTTGVATVTAMSASVYDVTVSGGDLPGLNGTVGLNLNPAQNIRDLASNPLPAGEPPVDEVYTLDNATSLAHIVISEFRNTGNNEFIELYNPTENWVDMSGWKINVSDSSGNPGSTRATIPQSTILRSGQYYLVANNNSNGGYSNPSVPANLTYGTGIADDGGFALLTATNNIVDQVGMSATSIYREGTHLPPSSSQSYERRPGGIDFGNNCQDTNDNASDFVSRSPDPQNYSTRPLRVCDDDRLDPVDTTTTITADTPDPSLTNGNVSVTVSVTGGSPLPSGRVNVTTTQTSVSCSITLNSAGTGTCVVRFTTTGIKTITATYLGDNLHHSSSDTESHQVTTVIRTPTRTRTPTALPPQPLVAINEFVPRPGHDWNLDGVVNTGDEYIELINHGVVDAPLSGYRLDDEANIGSSPYSLPSVTLKPGERIVFYGSETGLLLSDGGDGVRLLKPNGQLVDAYNYYVVRFPDQSYCRLPDNGGLDDWNQNCFPTPGLQNSLSGSAVNPPTSGQGEPLCPIADTLPDDFVFAECLPFGHNIWNSAYWDRFGWFDEQYLPNSPGKWPLFAD